MPQEQSSRVNCRMEHLVLPWPGKDEPDVSLEMIEALARQLRIVCGLGKHERALDDRLRVPRQAARRPVARNDPIPHGRGDIRLERRGMAEDAVGTGVANGGREGIDFLDHGADQAGVSDGFPVMISFRKAT